MGSIGSVASSANSGSGLDIQALVDQTLAAERQPEVILQNQQHQLAVQAAAFRDINTKLLALADKVDQLRDISGEFNAKSVTVSGSAAIAVTANAYAVTGAHTVVVNNLATTSSCYSNQLASSSAEFATGSFDIAVGGATTTISVDDTNNTLDGLAAAINAREIGVLAGVITDANGSRLSLLSRNSGALGDITIANDTSGVSFTKATAGVNASAVIDGVPISSAGNTITTAVEGLSIELLAETGGTPAAVRVEADIDRGKNAITEFVDAYNLVVKTINDQFTYDSSVNKAGALSGDATLRDVQQRLLTAVNTAIDGNNGFVNLGTVGLEMQNDGTISVDETQLDDALAGNFDDVRTLFQSAPGAVFQTLATALDAVNDSVEGPINVALNGISENQASIDDQLEDFESRIAMRSQQLEEQFSKLDALMRQLPVMLAQINAQLAGLR